MKTSHFFFLNTLVDAKPWSLGFRTAERPDDRDAGPRSPSPFSAPGRSLGSGRLWPASPGPGRSCTHRRAGAANTEAGQPLAGLAHHGSRGGSPKPSRDPPARCFPGVPETPGPSWADADAR